jgi:hypothetical protein
LWSASLGTDDEAHWSRLQSENYRKPGGLNIAVGMIGAPNSTQGQRVVDLAAVKAPTSSLHAKAIEACLFGLDEQEQARFQRGKTKRRTNFRCNAETLYIDALDSVSVVERMEALQKIIAVFEPDPESTTDNSMFELQVQVITAIMETLDLEDFPKAQALCMHALTVLYPAPPKVEPPPKKDPKEKSKPKFAAPPKRTERPGARRGAAKAQAKQPATVYPQIVERADEPKVSSVLAAALKLTGKEVVWYVRMRALRLISRIAPWTLVLGYSSRKEEPNAESAISGLVKLVEDERNEHVRYALIQTIFDMQAFEHVIPKVRGSTMVSLIDRVLIDPAISIRMLIMCRLGPMVNPDPYTSQPCDREALETILCMFNDTSIMMRCLATETILKIVTKKDDTAILNQIFDQIKDIKTASFIRRRLSAAERILPLLGKLVPPEFRPPQVSQQEKGKEDQAAHDLSPANCGRELSVLIVAPLTTPGNKQVSNDMVKLLSDDDHFVRLAAAKVLAHLAPDDQTMVSRIIKLIEGVSVEEKKKAALDQQARTERAKGRGSSPRSRNQPREQKQPVQEQNRTLTEQSETEEKGREWIKIMPAVFALQLLVGNGPGLANLLEEVGRLLPHYDAAVRRAAVELLYSICVHSEDKEQVTRKVIQVAMPSLKSQESWEAREAALHVISGLAEGSKECIAPVLACLMDTSWRVRHEAAVALIKSFEKCTDPAKMTALVQAVATPEAQGLTMDHLHSFMQRSAGEGFALALDVLRVLSEGNEDLRKVLGGRLRAELRIAPENNLPGGHCPGSYLLAFPVSENVAILLESHRAQWTEFERTCEEVADLRRADSSDIFSRSLSKFKKASEAEIVQAPLPPDEFMQDIPGDQPDFSSTGGKNDDCELFPSLVTPQRIPSLSPRMLPVAFPSLPANAVETSRGEVRAQQEAHHTKDLKYVELQGQTENSCSDNGQDNSLTVPESREVPADCALSVSFVASAGAKSAPLPILPSPRPS